MRGRSVCKYEDKSVAASEEADFSENGHRRGTQAMTGPHRIVMSRKLFGTHRHVAEYRSVGGKQRGPQAPAPASRRPGTS